MAGWVPVVDEQDPDWQKCLEIYQATFPKEVPNAYAVAGVIAGEVFAEGLRRAGRDLTWAKMISSLEAINNWNGVMAKDINCGPNERAGKISMYFLKAQDNQFVTISGWVRPQ
ncbi:MAG: ABC transporter substrate-binding protein [Firmicutes bacterium]|jgi:branched-chain amino acid transport system substrate-binding protein|nr:ABC transporter substrate-binding protein [Bacillota bacterium]